MSKATLNKAGTRKRVDTIKRLRNKHEISVYIFTQNISTEFILNFLHA